MIIRVKKLLPDQDIIQAQEELIHWKDKQHHLMTIIWNCSAVVLKNQFHSNLMLKKVMKTELYHPDHHRLMEKLITQITIKSTMN